MMRKSLGALVLTSALQGCMYSPATGTKQESSANLTVYGLTAGSGQPVSVQARNWDTDLPFPVTAVNSTGTEYGDSGYFVWSASVPASALSPTHWKPTFLGPIASLGGPFNAMGRLELTAFQNTTRMYTFSAGAQDCVDEALGEGASVEEAGSACTDSQTLARFDVSGWNAPVPGGPLTIYAQKTITHPTPAGTAPVNVKIVTYASSGASVWGMVCAPVDSVRHRLMIYNHGGGAGTGVVDAARCLDSARRGWVYAMSAYRGEPLYIPNEPTDWPIGADWTSWAMQDVGGNLLPLRLSSSGRFEVSLGEVMDVHRLLQLMLTQSNVDATKVFMWGHSHGGTITLRAVQSGAEVQAAAAVAPATDWAELVRQCQLRDTPPHSLPTDDACSFVLWGGTYATVVVPSTRDTVGGPPPAPPPPPTPPAPPTVNALLRSYDWRSPQFFAADLALRDDVTLLVQHGLADNVVLPNQSCKLAASSFEDYVGNAWRVPLDAAPGEASTVNLLECPGITFASTPRPISDWEHQKRYLLIYDGLDHVALRPFPLVSRLWEDFNRFQLWLESGW